jgi:MoaA/NifB/PqqE/SkfB family radical SAM enzyme
MNTNSFISANSLPYKIFLDEELLNSLKNNFILPRHFQISPTNACNLNCSFCSCKNRNKKENLSIQQLDKLLNYLVRYKTVGVTITGGGEPALHPNINELITNLNSNNIKIGLVSNGTRLSNITQENISRCTWIRISFGDDRLWDKNFIENIDYMGESGNDLAFSYVVSEKYNFNNIQRIVSYANDYSFTHIRLVSDIYNPNTQIMEDIKHKLVLEHLDDSLVIYQAREEYTRGAKKCLISLLKPLISADGNLYPCCGVMYSMNDVDHTFPERMIMGNLDNLENIWDNQKYFNGSICIKCYYSNYNILLNTLLSKIQHKEFV